MSEPTWTPSDQPARDRIHQDLATCLLVEAGAGSGKTTAMVGRMIELIRTGTATVDQIAAVTFTRKAAGELRERFQERLEQEHRRLRLEVEVGPERRSTSNSNLNLEGGATDLAATEQRLAAALADLPRCFVGTIHSFCGRLLRERPLEAGVPPGFEEVTGADEERLRLESWGRFLERLGSRDSRLARRLASLGLRPAQLRGLFVEVSDNPDVRYPTERVEPPSSEEIAAARDSLERLLDEALAILPEEELGDPDALQKKVRRLKFHRWHPGLRSDADLLEALSIALEGKNEVTLVRWSDDKAVKARVKELSARWTEWCESSPARALLDRWLAVRYPQALRLARAAAGLYAAERRRAGQLNFGDLLLLTARLLREHPEVRRDLGRRIRYLLVDEFQDTDPIQAEIVFLLASEPAGEREGWMEAVPRPGALFVVGDPKQSIYRFRRADISVYGQVKRRFREIGDVLGLTANFRSTRPIEALVDAAFRGPLPEEETPHQAAFAPLAVKPESRPGEGVFWYRFEPAAGYGGFTGARISGPESDLLAGWIAERISGGRTPSDFLVLTRTKGQLAAYARALESRNVAVQVSGAGVGVEAELADFVLLLRALCDPGDPVLTLAVLEGLFFGLSHEELYAHVRLGGTFSFPREDHPEGSAATEPLRLLREFWGWARSAPADVVVPRIVERLGILPYAAAGELAATRAGALLLALDAIRAAGERGMTSLLEAVERLEAALDDEAEAPLFPGEANAVRVMNLHKAKGLEAPVVVLACPAADGDHPIVRHVARDERGGAVGWVQVFDASRQRGSVIASPLDWARYEEAEAPFAAGEAVRLLYVAATRAADELVVARCTRTEDKSVWQALHAALDAEGIATELKLETRPPVERLHLEEDAASITRRGAEVRVRRESLSRPTYAVGAVTRLAKGSVAFTAAGGGGVGRGIDWGRAVHRALELAARGVVGHDLAQACRSILLEEGRPRDDYGAPQELEELTELLETLRRSALWRRSLEADRVLIEVPFQLAVAGAEAAVLGLGDGEQGGDATPRIVEGVIDLAFRDVSGGWTIADYKTDRFPSVEARRERTAIYQRQVDLYARCWERLTGETVRGRVLFFTHTQDEVSWQAPVATPASAAADA